MNVHKIINWSWVMLTVRQHLYHILKLRFSTKRKLSGILNKFNKSFFHLVETLKQIKQYFFFKAKIIYFFLCHKR